MFYKSLITIFLLMILNGCNTSTVVESNYDFNNVYDLQRFIADCASEEELCEFQIANFNNKGGASSFLKGFYQGKLVRVRNAKNHAIIRLKSLHQQQNFY